MGRWDTQEQKQSTKKHSGHVSVNACTVFEIKTDSSMHKKCDWKEASL